MRSFRDSNQAKAGEVNASNSVPDDQKPNQPRRRDRLLAWVSGTRSRSTSRAPSPIPPITNSHLDRDAVLMVNDQDPTKPAAGATAIGETDSPGQLKSPPSNAQSKVSSAKNTPPLNIIAGVQSPTNSNLGAPEPLPIVRGQQTIDSMSTLWDEAYNKLPAEDKANLDRLQLDKLRILQQLFGTAEQAKENCIANRWKIRWGDKEINVREKAERLMGWITKFQEIGDIIIQYDPVHAALPWAGVRAILKLVSGEQELMAAAVVGMERIAYLIARCAIYEQLYLSSNIPEIAQDATTEFRKTLLVLYTTILKILSVLIQVFGRNILQNITSIVTIPAEIKELEGPESAVNTAAAVVESCYHSDTRVQHAAEFAKLRTLLNEFVPIMADIDTTTKRIYKDIEENKRVKILEWLSTVPYQGHHDLACEGCVQGTGHWLFQRKEFVRWQQAMKSNILWLHGIPGAGKTKLVSAAIETLKGNGEKVAFFYCKRDEENRRDRQKIILSLVKQFACPANATGIHSAILEAYEKEQKDPSSRVTLTIDTSLALLATLLDDFKAPIILLDALDECPTETRGLIIKDFLSVIAKSTRTVKILISSRHSLDIADSLRGLPHVCIEARDNAEDIENYVKREIESRVQDRRLLRGRVSPPLIELIHTVLLRDANGMFLWVDYQIRQLCKLAMEKDIRVRLGKLPKDLRGVYDEIMEAIQLQEGSGPKLAHLTLQWMSVAQRPLTPKELVSAIEIDPRIPIHTTSPLLTHPCEPESLEPALDIELVIQLCGGLILWDKELDVMRFAHLSVQEYLESSGGNKDWDMVDAQLYVAESCLWALQDPHNIASTPEHHLYDYVALNWFRHCSSFQDLLQAQALSKEPSEHVLDIPLLNSFLGSFYEASAHFVKWHNTLSDLSYKLAHIVQNPTPVSPMFAVAYSGLVELINWLWVTPGIWEKPVQNDAKNTLLSTAAASGHWKLVEKILFQISLPDFDDNGGDTGLTLAYAAAGGNRDVVDFLLDKGANINSHGLHGATVLVGAVEGGHKDLVIHLVNRGADVNMVGGTLGTALATAAYEGEMDIVSYLLDRGADINMAGGYYGSALSAAASAGGKDIVSYLLDRGADINMAGGHHGSALAAAAYGGKKDIVSYLLDRGADINMAGGDYGTALAAAALAAEKDIVSYLLDRGADINMAGGYYGSALSAAASAGGKDIVSYLLDRGADINIVSGGFGTALAAAAYMGEEDLVEYLLSRGAQKPPNWEGSESHGQNTELVG